MAIDYQPPSSFKSCVHQCCGAPDTLLAVIIDCQMEARERQGMRTLLTRFLPANGSWLLVSAPGQHRTIASISSAQLAAPLAGKAAGSSTGTSSGTGPGSSLARQPATRAEAKAPKSTICITGASGYLGSRVVERLLATGHTVHAVCFPKELEDPANRLAHVTSLPGADTRLKLFPGDVTKPGACDEALQGASHLLHCAAVVKLIVPRAEQKHMVDTALDGTRNVLESVNAQAGKVGKVVMISSLAAVVSENRERGGPDYVYSEKDWAINCRQDYCTYSYAKRESERLANELASKQNKWRLATINPGVVFGPVSYTPHTESSPGMLKSFMNGEVRMNLFTGFSDVDDVAAAACSALFNKSATGRHLVLNKTTGYPEIIEELKRVFPGWAPGTASPRWLMPLILKASAALSGLDGALLLANENKPLQVDSSYARSRLGIPKFVDWQTTLTDCALSLSDLKLVAPVRPSKP